MKRTYMIVVAQNWLYTYDYFINDLIDLSRIVCIYNKHNWNAILKM